MLSVATAPPASNSRTEATGPACRLCGGRAHRTLIDFGLLPLSTRPIAADTPDDPPQRLHIQVCDTCALVQRAGTAPRQAYPFPGPNPGGSWAETLRKRLKLAAGSVVIQIVAGDPSVLRDFQAAGIQVLAVGPDAAPMAGVPTETAIFDTDTAMRVAVRYGRAGNLVIADGVLQQVPSLFDFAAGLACVLRPNGLVTLQVPHLLALVQNNRLDAFSHDVHSYLSLRVVEHAFRSVGLRVMDAECLPDHGGMLRIDACHTVGPHPARPALKAVRQAEAFAELGQRDLYSGFTDRVGHLRTEIRDFLRTRRAAGRRVAGYGVTAPGTMLLNICGITMAEMACVAGPAFDGLELPGCRIPIVAPDTLLADPPDDLVILPWPDPPAIGRLLAPLRRHGTQCWSLIPRIARF